LEILLQLLPQGGATAKLLDHLQCIVLMTTTDDSEVNGNVIFLSIIATTEATWTEAQSHFFVCVLVS